MESNTLQQNQLFAATVCREFAASRQTRGKFFFSARKICREVTAEICHDFAATLPHRGKVVAK
jgi:hypothetical protein